MEEGTQPSPPHPSHLSRPRLLTVPQLLPPHIALLPTFPHLLPLITGVPRSVQQLSWEARSLHGKTPGPTLRHSWPVCPGLCPEGAEAASTEKWGLGSLSCDLGDYSPAAFKCNLPSPARPPSPSPFTSPTQPHSTPPLPHYPLALLQETLEPMPTLPSPPCCSEEVALILTTTFHRMVCFFS